MNTNNIRVSGTSVLPKQMIKLIHNIIDFFYIKPLRFIPKNTFRYAFVGGANVLFSMVLFWFFYNYILFQKDVDFGIVVISAPVVSMFVSFVVTLLTGFWLTKNIVFSGSFLSGRTQLFRYTLVVVINLLINFFGLKLFINVFGFYASISYALIQIINVTFSYTMQRFFTFKGHK